MVASQTDPALTAEPHYRSVRLSTRAASNYSVVTELLFAKEGTLRFVPMGMVVCIRHIQLQRDFHTCLRRLEADVL
jgi:hypothetical protein